MIDFRAVTQAQGPDGGIDIILYSADNPESIGALVQCKRWTSLVGPKAVREFLGLPKEKILVIGISIGYPDSEARLNSYQSTRIGLDDFVKWS